MMIDSRGIKVHIFVDLLCFESACQDLLEGDRRATIWSRISGFLLVAFLCSPLVLASAKRDSYETMYFYLTAKSLDGEK